MFDINAELPDGAEPLAKAHPAQDALAKGRLKPATAWPFPSRRDEGLESGTDEKPADRG